ncbi:hypothetical protein [Methylobacterium organophilum]|nr:hypothetical protein [Methylobacterium organophilum]GJE29763.1 hypothetical protein LKMONMHP_4649 [Methylobacterium organophilum]
MGALAFTLATVAALSFGSAALTGSPASLALGVVEACASGLCWIAERLA